jgi:ubiquitin carboxyl-terminal hydrolase 4/11
LTFSFFVSYGSPPYPLPRKAIERGRNKEISLELYPPRLKVIRLAKDDVWSNPAGPSHPLVTVSSSDSLKTLCVSLASAVADASPFPRYRVWKVKDDTHFKKPEFPLYAMSYESPQLVQDKTDTTVGDEGYQSLDPFVVEFQENGEWIYEQPKLFSQKNQFFNRFGNSSSTSTLGGLYNSFAKQSYSSLTNGRSPYSPSKPLQPGVLGLGNMYVLDFVFSCILTFTGATLVL